MKYVSNIRHVVALAATVLVFTMVLRSSPDTSSDKGSNRGDWTMFGGSSSRDLVNLTEKGIPTKWDVEKGTNIKWSIDLGSKAYGGPIVAGGRIYIGTNNGQPRDKAIEGDKGVLMCFDEAKGTFLWQTVHDKLAAGRVNDWPDEGICSSVLVEGDRLYYVNNRAEVICAEAAKGGDKGKVYWKLDMIGELGVFPHNLAVCSPLVVGDKLFVITANGVDEGHINIPRPDAPSFLALDKKTGKVLWKDNAPSQALAEANQRGVKVDIRKDLVDKGKVLMHGQWSNPVYAEPNGKPMVIFPGGDGWMRAYNPDNGELIWKFDCNPKNSKYFLGVRATRNDFLATPVVWENKLYIGVGQDPEHKTGEGHLWCIDITKQPKNKDKDLTPVNNNFDPKAEVNKDSGLVWHYGGKAPPGVRRNYQYSRTVSTCAVHDGLCYAADFDGYLYCLDANTGEKYWEDQLGENKRGSSTWCSPSWVDGKIYIGTENGNVLIYQHGKTKKRLSKIHMGAEAVRATPVAVHGVLYVMTENPTKLWAISTKK